MRLLRGSSMMEKYFASNLRLRRSFITSTLILFNKSVDDGRTAISQTMSRVSVPGLLGARWRLKYKWSCMTVIDDGC